jgi:hypothetical protein
VNILPNNATQKDVEEFFTSADKDTDGFLTKEEIKSAFNENGQTLSDAELDAAFTKADIDADGKLSLEELKKFLVPEDSEIKPVDPSPPVPENTTVPTNNETQPFDNKTQPVDNSTTPTNNET